MKRTTGFAVAFAQIAAAADNIRNQTEQTSRAMQEQSRAMREMTGAANNTAKQIKLITAANREHSTASAAILAALADIRQVTERNAQGVQETLSGATRLLNLTATKNDSKAHRGNGKAVKARK